MLLSLLKRSDFRDLAPFMSPALLSVVPLGATLRRCSSVVAGASRSNSKEFDVLSRRFDGWVCMGGGNGIPLSNLSDQDRESVGRKILQVYFAQLFYGESTRIDLRARAWSVVDGELHWSPSAGSIRWESGFIEPMRGVYRAYYDGDDAGFNSSLHELGLGSAAHIFREHLGSDNPDRVQFDRDLFVQSFGKVFEHCKSKGLRLHPDFVLLGIYLAALYDALDVIGLPLNVRAAFRAAVSQSTQR